MKFFQHTFGLFAAVLFCLSAHSQVVEKLQDWTSVSQSVDISAKSGYEFRLTAAIRVEKGRKNSIGSLWARVDKKDGETGFFLNASNVFKATTEWKVFEIKGIIDGNAAVLNIGAYCQNGGDFYFDDFKLEVRYGKEKWKTIALTNPGFEEASPQNDAWKSGIGKSTDFTVKDYSIEYSANKPWKGKRSLMISSRMMLGSNDNGKYVDANGASLYYETYGEGEPLLMIHGNGGSMSAFMNQVDFFAKQYKVILVDCRGRGNSSYPPNVPLTFDLQVEDISQFLDKLNIPKTNILGWSDGGIIGLMMAMQHPEKVDRLICMGANIFPEGCKDIEGMKKVVSDSEKVNDNHQYDLLIDLYNLDIKYPQLRFEDLKVIQSKTLVMAGDYDEIKGEHTLRIFESIPGAQLAIMPNSSHFAAQQNPQVFNEIVMKFLKG